MKLEVIPIYQDLNWIVDSHPIVAAKKHHLLGGKQLNVIVIMKV